MLTCNPVPGARDQVKIRTAFISKNLLNGSLLRVVQCDACYAKAHCSTHCIHDHYAVADMQITQVPEYSRGATRTIKVPIDYRASHFSWPWASGIPAHIIPRAKRRCRQVAIVKHANHLHSQYPHQLKK